MDKLPDLPISLITPPLQETDLLESSKQEFRALILQTIDEIKQRFANVTSQTVQTLTQSFHQEIIAQADSILSHSTKPIDCSPIKKFLETLQNSIQSLERLIFLSRYFNPENDSAFLKTLTLKSSQLSNIIFNFNTFMIWWIKALLDNTQLDPKDLLAMLLNSKEKGIHAISTNLLTAKVPQQPAGGYNKLNFSIIMDYYYLKSTYGNIKKLCEDFTEHQVPEKVQKMINSFGDSASLSSPALIEFGESFSQANPVVLELKKELERLEKAQSNVESVEFLYDPKERLDEVIKEVEKYEEEIRTASTKYITQTVARHEGQQNFDNDSVPIEDLSEIIVQEMRNLCILKKETLQDFLKNWENEAKSEILRLFGRQRDMLQDHIGHYIEERLVTFHQGKGDFANANIVKYIQDFCVTASKEYKRALATKIEQEYEIWPLYFCYVAQNLCDFYLVEYTADSSVLRVYLTAAPMLSTLYKHLSKLDMQKIGKKNVLVTVLNYYDKDISLEFRQVFINPDQIIFDQTKHSKIPQGLKDLIYITIFLLYNTPASQPSSEIHLTSKDFAAFFNYTADYHSVYQQMTGKIHHNANLITPIKVQTTPNLGHASPGSPLSSPGDFSPGYSAGLGSAWKISPALFDFRAPFIDLKQEKNNGYLVHIKGDVFYENSVVVRRNIAQQYNDMLQFKPLGVDGGDQQGNMDNEVLRYLKRNEKKPGFNFDGVEYLQGYIKKKKEGAGLVKVLGKKESQRIYNLYKTDSGETLKDLTIYNKYTRVFLVFGYHTEIAPGFMIVLDRTRNIVNIFKHQRSSAPEDEEFSNFGVFFSEMLGLNHPKVNHIKCKIGDETILKYLKDHYFPFTILLNVKITVDTLEVQPSLQDVKLTEQDLVDSFKDFLTLSISANNLEVFKACNVALEEKANNAFRIMNLGTAMKFDRLKAILSTLVEKIVLDRVQNILVSFNFLGATGNKTYYMYLYETPDKGNNGEAMSPGSSMVPGGRLRYIVDVFTLDNNLEFDNKEVLVVVAHMSQVLTACQLILNGAYILNSRDNILLYNQPDLVLNTLRYLVFVGNVPLEKAFQRVAKSFISHYEILDGILNQVSLVSQAPLLALKHRSLSAPQGSETFDFSQAKLHDPQEKAILIKAALQKKTAISDWLFEDLTLGIEFYKGAQAKDIELLQAEEAKYYSEGLDMQTFVNVLNYEEIAGAFLFLVDEQVMKKLLKNDETVLRNVSKFLIEEVTASKTKYEETLDVKYQGTELYFLVSQALFQSTKVFLIKYNVEKAQSTFYYVQEVPELQQANVLQEEISEVAGNVETVRSSERQGGGVLSNLDTVQSKEEMMSDSSRVIASGRETAVDEEEELVPKELRKLMENFNAAVTKSKKEKKRSEAKYVELEFSEEIRKTMKVQYGLVVKLMVYYLSHMGGYIGEKRLEIKGHELSGFLCDYADKLFYGYVEGSRIKDNYKSLCNTFLDKTNLLGKKSCLVTFLNGKATVEQIGILDNCIKSFKQDFQKILGIEHGFFCFRIAVGQAVKSFMMHLSGKGKKNLVLTIYNNGSESDDGVIEKLIRTYSMEDAATGSEDILISKVQVYNLNMVNTLFWGYLELTTFLMANEAANEVENIVEYCAKLAYSPLEYLKDLKEFEEKCEKLGILVEMQRTVSQISYISQMSPS